MDILVFDVNETLLDLKALDSLFVSIYGDARAREEWFALLLQRAFTATLAGPYRSFSEIGKSALEMLAEKRGVAVDDAQIEKILTGLKQLPAHSDAAPALEMLKDEHFTLAALTQSPQQTLELQMRSSGLAPFFDRLFSVERVERYKPDPAPYRMVASEIGCETKSLRMVSAHAWDIEGAMRVGCKAAFVARPGQGLDPASDPPDIAGADLQEVTLQILGSAGALKS